MFSTLRLRYLYGVPKYSAAFEGWKVPDDLDFDTMFYGQEMPPAFTEVLGLTRHALRAFSEYAKRDGFELLVAVTDHKSPAQDLGRHPLRETGRTRIFAMLSELGIPGSTDIGTRPDTHGPRMRSRTTSK